MSLRILRLACLAAASGVAGLKLSFPGATQSARAPTPTSPAAQTAPASLAAVPPPPSDSESKPGRSALVLAWFYATPREREFVRRMYLRNGFTHVVVEESPVKIFTKPRGWYRRIRKQSFQNVMHPLSQHFDVVHCMSGGFLNLYALYRSGVQLRCDTLLLDSTPILPKPAAFTRFARAYMESVGLTLPLKLVSRRLQERAVASRWGAGLRYVRAKHGLLNALGKPAPGLDAWTGPTGPVGLALGGRWDELEEGEVCSRIFRSEAKVVQQVVFMYNPNDPFLDAADVERVMGYATRAGYPVRAEHVDDEHVKTLFTSPRKVFGLLQPTDPSLISL